MKISRHTIVVNERLFVFSCHLLTFIVEIYLYFFTNYSASEYLSPQKAFRVCTVQILLQFFISNAYVGTKQTEHPVIRCIRDEVLIRLQWYMEQYATYQWPCYRDNKLIGFIRCSLQFSLGKLFHHQPFRWLRNFHGQWSFYRNHSYIKTRNNKRETSKPSSGFSHTG